MRKTKNALFLYIILALVLGIVLGYIVHISLDENSIKSFSKNIKLLGTVFIRLIQMIVAPLVFSTLVVGITKMGDLKMVGRIGGRAMLWFIIASLVSLFIGMAVVNIGEPGKHSPLDIHSVETATDLVAQAKGFTFEGFITHLIPKSFFEAMANNEILQILVFSILFGVVLSSFGKEAAAVNRVLELISKVILRMVNYIMWVAPFAVFGTIAAAVASHGLGIFALYWKFLLYFAIGIAILWMFLLIVGYVFLGKKLFQLFIHIKEPILIAFSTTSSEAVFPKLVEELERLGCSRKVVSLILPLGYSFNLDGGMMYITFASVFLAQIYGVEMDFATQLTMLLVLMLTSKGVAGVPRAALIVVVATCSTFGIPPEGVALLLPIDHFCDMLRSATNVVGNSIATTTIDQWEQKGEEIGEVV